MNKTKLAGLGIGTALLLIAGNSLAESPAINTMAKITMELNHYPSEDDKVALQAIIDSDESSEEEAAIAMALSNLQHEVSEADAERLVDIVDDEFAESAAKTLAGIVLSLNHAPTAADKKALEALAR